MIIHNKTNRTLELRTFDFRAKNYSTIYIGANSSTDLHYSISVVGIEKLINSGIIQVGNIEIPTSIPTEDSSSQLDVTPETDSSDPADEVDEGTTPEDLVPDTQEDTSAVNISEDSSSQEEVEEGDNFVCKICGGEYASARGLTNHMNKAHKNDLPEEV